ncbi:MAG: helix-turn-helix transcriptional regulator [Actinomycetota bacterium]|nr:helix-turn-helix transcriptional regulator [Actinomycetota bacterium]
MSPTAGTPHENNQPVGAVLARMRRDKRLTGARLAAMVGMSQPKISRIERGRGQVDPEDVGMIARALGADEPVVQALVEQAERSLDRMTDWRPTDASLAARQKTLLDWESAAHEIRAFEPALIPGPLQTDGYAKLVIQTFRRLAPMIVGQSTDAAVAEAVMARVQRQKILTDESKTLDFVLGEAALKSGRYPPVEMLNQIHRLRQIADNRRVRITVIPDEAPIEIPLLHGFFVYDDDLVVVDLYNTGLLSRSPRDVETYRRVFDALGQNATDIGPLLDKYEEIYIDALQASRRARR